MRTLEVRLSEARSIDENGCWNWQNYRNEKGYGITKVGGRKGRLERVHRLSFQIHCGPITEGFNVLHHCDNPACFNPEHLFLGTAADNTQDMLTKGRWRKPRYHSGERNITSKLTELAVKDAIRRLLAGETRSSIARHYGVSLSAISHIALGKSWKHLSAGSGITKSPRGRRKTQ